MTTPREPNNLPTTSIPVQRPGSPNLGLIAVKAADMYDKHRARADALREEAKGVPDTLVHSARGGAITVARAGAHAEEIHTLIEHEGANGSLRHRLVGRFTKWSLWLIVVLVDFPIMLWACSSVFNVDWADPIGVRLLFSLAAAVLSTLAAATALHHFGRELREHKNERRGLTWRALTLRPRLVLIAVTVLVVLVALLMYVRVYTEGVFSGLSTLATLLALLVAFVMLISATLVFWTAFRDGSLETDDLRHYTGLVEPSLNRMRDLLARAAAEERAAELLRRQAERAYWRE
jgi:hypothetical protein